MVYFSSFFKKENNFKSTIERVSSVFPLGVLLDVALQKLWGSKNRFSGEIARSQIWKRSTENVLLGALEHWQLEEALEIATYKHWKFKQCNASNWKVQMENRPKFSDLSSAEFEQLLTKPISVLTTK